MPTEHHSASPSTLRELRELNARFIANFVANDAEAHAALLHPLFVYIRGDGAYVDRATYLRDWATGFDPEVIVYWDVRDEAIVQIGNLALVRAVNKCVERTERGETASMTIYTDVYVYEGGRWLCLQAQITPMAPGAETADGAIISVWRKGVLQKNPPHPKRARRTLARGGRTAAPRTGTSD